MNTKKFLPGLKFLTLTILNQCETGMSNQGIASRLQEASGIEIDVRSVRSTLQRAVKDGDVISRVERGRSRVTAFYSLSERGQAGVVKALALVCSLSGSRDQCP